MVYPTLDGTPMLVQRDDMFRDDITKGEKGAIGCGGTPDFHLMSAGDQTSNLVMKRPVSSAGRKVMPDSYSHHYTPNYVKIIPNLCC